MARNLDASEQGTKIPIFGGDNALCWTQQLERYYLRKGIAEDEKMQASMEALEGRALSWFPWWNRCNPNPSWEGFKIAVVRRFQPSMMQNPFEVLLSLKQTGTVKDYAMEFEKYVGALREIDPEFVKGIFLKGLREEIQMEVRSNDPYSLSEIIQQAIFKDQEREESEVAAEERVTEVVQQVSEADGDSIYESWNPNLVKKERAVAVAVTATVETSWRKIEAESLFVWRTRITVLEGESESRAKMGDPNLVTVEEWEKTDWPP